MMPMDHSPSRATDLTVSFAPMRGRGAAREPITVGLPFPRGILHDIAALALVDEHNRNVSLDAAVTERWADGSVRWALLDFQAAGSIGTPARYRLEMNGRVRPDAPHPMRVAVTPALVDVRTGPVRFVMRAGGPAIFDEIFVGSHAPRRHVGSLVVTDRTGRDWPMQIARVGCEHEGRLRTTVKLEGHAGPRLQ